MNTHSHTSLAHVGGTCSKLSRTAVRKSVACAGGMHLQTAWREVGNRRDCVTALLQQCGEERKLDGTVSFGSRGGGNHLTLLLPIQRRLHLMWLTDLEASPPTLFAHIPNLCSDTSTHTHRHTRAHKHTHRGICSSRPKGESCLKAVLDSSLWRQQETLEGSRDMCRSPGAGPPPCCFGASYLCYFGRGLHQSVGVWAVQLLAKAPDLICLKHHLHGLGWNKQQEKRGVTSTEAQPLAPGTNQ